MFVYTPVGGRKRGRDGRVVIKFRTADQQAKLQKQHMQDWECQQQLHSVQRKDQLVTGCQPKGKRNSIASPVQRPRFIIQAPWGILDKLNDPACPVMFDNCDGDNIINWNGMTYHIGSSGLPTGV
jgi:hypothetical protein